MKINKKDKETDKEKDGKKEEKKKDKKSKKSDKNDKDKDTDSASGSHREDDDTTPTGQGQIRLDSEGYIIRDSPPEPKESRFYSSSDDSSDEDEKPTKLRIAIRPLGSGDGAPKSSASLDILENTVKNLTLAPPSHYSSRRSQARSANATPVESITGSQRDSKYGNNLGKMSASSLQLNRDMSVTNSIPNSHTNSHASAFKSTATEDRYAILREILSQYNHDQGTENPAPNPPNPIDPSAPPLPACPPPTTINPSSVPSAPFFSQSNMHKSMSRQNAFSNVHHENSVSSLSSISRCDSTWSLSSDFRATPISVNSSRGPSPLTLGMNDTIPLAVAFQESISAMFKGTDETRCQINMLGSLKLSFPAGIIQVGLFVSSFLRNFCSWIICAFPGSYTKSFAPSIEIPRG